MKRYLIILAASVLLCFSAGAQTVSCHFGAQGGVTLNKLTNLSETFKGKSLPGWHAGATFELKLPAYFSIQPSVNFEQSRSQLKLQDASAVSTLNVNCINVPISLQWGPDLGVVRLYAQAVPFVDFMLGGKMPDVWNADWGQVKDYLGTAQFGVGVGAGLELWRIQFSFRYNWGLGNWSKIKEGSPFNLSNYQRQGMTFTLAYLFL